MMRVLTGWDMQRGKRITGRMGVIGGYAKGKSVFAQITANTNYLKFKGKEFTEVYIDEEVTMNEDCKEMTEAEMKDKERVMQEEEARQQKEILFDRRLVYNQIKKQRNINKPNFKTKFLRRKH
ncbi:MAG: hypothetical protein WCL06_00090 [Bacteroidota bacterium]